jgi:glutamyl-Q tRNA(Asp) synthetase
MEKAISLAGRDLSWEDLGAGRIEADPGLLGDVVLARKDIRTSYHLAVTVDDAAQGVTLITRGKDLFHATHVHRLLQTILGLPEPRWYHHDLILDGQGRRLAKRDASVELRELRGRGAHPRDIRAMISDQLEQALAIEFGRAS